MIRCIKSHIILTKGGLEFKPIHTKEQVNRIQEIVRELHPSFCIKNFLCFFVLGDNPTIELCLIEPLIVK